jgi:hypothetical protein
MNGAIPEHIKGNIVGYLAMALLTGYISVDGGSVSPDKVAVLADAAQARESRLASIEQAVSTAHSRLHQMDVRLAAFEVRQLAIQEAIRTLQSYHPAKMGEVSFEYYAAEEGGP